MNEPTRRNRLRHGLYTMQKAVQTLGSRALPSRSTALGRALHEWRTALIADLGGEDAVLTQQRALVELVAVRRAADAAGVSDSRFAREAILRAVATHAETEG
jgi:hypothetical protein